MGKVKATLPELRWYYLYHVTMNQSGTIFALCEQHRKVFKFPQHYQLCLAPGTLADDAYLPAVCCKCAEAAAMATVAANERNHERITFNQWGATQETMEEIASIQRKQRKIPLDK